MRIKEEKLVSLPKPNSQPRHRPLRWLVSGVSAVAAVVVIAIMVTALVFSHGAKPSGTGSAPNTASTSSQSWQALPNLTNVSDLPVIAPSNPQVVYKAKMASSNLPATVTLQRSDDDGATWHTLPLPAGITQVYSASIMVSPLSDQRVFIELPEPCPTAQANTIAPAFSPLSGGANDCIPVYFSADGGAHWSLLHFPVHQAGSRPYFSGVTPYGLQAQGNRLYMLLYVAGPISANIENSGGGSGSLVSSDDGGATWQFADQPLTAQANCVMGYAATPTGSTVFAATLDQCSSASGVSAAMSSPTAPLSGGGGDTNYQLWRSDDAGADWTLIGPVSDSRLHLSLNGAGQPALFLAPQGPALGRDDPGIAPQFSTDGGKTWQNGPLPAGQANSTDILGTLSDGSIIVSFTDNTTQKNHLFAWKPGDAAWHQLNGTFQGTPQYLLVIPSGNGQQTLWLVTQANSDQTGDYTVQRVTL